MSERMPDWAELWMAINGADARSAEEQADQFMSSTLNGLTIHVGLNSEIVRKALVDQFKFAEARARITPPAPAKRTDDGTSCGKDESNGK